LVRVARIPGTDVAQKLIIDADPGIGDAVAVALALSDPELDVVAVTACAGRVAGPVATRNAQAIVEELDPPKWPRLGSSSGTAVAESIDYRATPVTSADLNGENGLGDCLLRIAEMHHIRDSAKVMVDIVRNEPDEITILTLGPLTNVDMACELDPEFISRIRGLFCLGGSVDKGGDVTAAAELNIYANPQAARNVLRSPAPKTLIPLEAAKKAVLTFDVYDRIFGSAAGRLQDLLSRLLPFALRAHHQHLGLEGFPLIEVTALCTLTAPQLFQTKRMAVDVETTGELTRGMTVFDRRGTPQWQTNIDVVRDVDTQGVLDYVHRIVRRGAS
jgi:inosine-uridine nucleoside N-ribohydrolase